MNSVLNYLKSTTNTQRFLAALVLQVSVIFLLILFKFLVVAGGTEVVLSINPVDPRDPLRGDYVTFEYTDLTRLDSYYFENQNVQLGDTIYVPLRRYGKTWQPESGSVSTVMPKSGTFIKGHVTYVDRSSYDGYRDLVPMDSTDTYNSYKTAPSYFITATIEYGIEEYYIPEGTGTTAWGSNGPTQAVVSVDGKGNAVLKKLYRNDKPWP
ncbi:GDYXXLXY domain-containing protein [candidate division WWE3 bacterium]|nr:GDYXXLXY domain-containing protein [candidate division WWE3 bacterium]